MTEEQYILGTDHGVGAGVGLLSLHIERGGDGEDGHGRAKEVRSHRPHRLLHLVPLRQDPLQDGVQGDAVLGDHGDGGVVGGEGGVRLTGSPVSSAGQKLARDKVCSGRHMSWSAGGKRVSI